MPETVIDYILGTILLHRLIEYMNQTYHQIQIDDLDQDSCTMIVDRMKEIQAEPQESKEHI